MSAPPIVVEPIPGDRVIVEVRDLVRQAVRDLEHLNALDPRVFAAQQHLLAAYAELIRFQHDIGGAR